MNQGRPRTKKRLARSTRQDREYLMRKREEFAGVPTIPHELHELLFAGQEPPPDLEAAAAESIRAACREFRRLDPRAKGQSPEDAL